MLMFLIAPLLILAFITGAVLGEPHVAESATHATVTTEVDGAGVSGGVDRVDGQQSAGSIIPAQQIAGASLIDCALFMLCMLALAAGLLTLNRRSVSVWFTVPRTALRWRLPEAKHEVFAPSLSVLSISRT